MVRVAPNLTYSDYQRVREALKEKVANAKTPAERARYIRAMKHVTHARNKAKRPKGGKKHYPSPKRRVFLPETPKPKPKDNLMRSKQKGTSKKLKPPSRKPENKVRATPMPIVPVRTPKTLSLHKTKTAAKRASKRKKRPTRVVKAPKRSKYKWKVVKK